MKLLLLFLILYAYSFGAPAFNKTREFTQADGTRFTARAYGDHHLNWIQSQDGEVLKYNSKTKNFEYAVIHDDNLESSGVKYQKLNSKRARSLGKINKLDIDDVYRLWRKKRQH